MKKTIKLLIAVTLVFIFQPFGSNALKAQQRITQARPTVSSSNNNTYNNSYSPYDENNNPDSIQNSTPEGIIFDVDDEADSVLRSKVLFFPMSHRAVKIYDIGNPSFDPTGAQLHNPAHSLDGNYYLDLGALGQSQITLFPEIGLATTGMLFPYNAFNNPSPVYRCDLHHNKLFQTQTPYTMLSYGSSLNKDYQIGIVHTQNITPRWNMAFMYDLVSRDGLYTNSEVTNHVIDITTNYYSADARYQLQAAVSLNRLRQQENGGVQNDTTCWSYTRRTGVPVNMYAAQNQWRDFEINVHQSFNTVRQFEYHRPIMKSFTDTITVLGDTAKGEPLNAIQITHFDSIIGFDTLLPRTPHTYNTGIFALDIKLSRHRRIFYDSQADSWFYNYSALDSSFIYDSSSHWNVSTELYWTNDAFMSHKWKNPFIVSFGVRPEYNRLQYATTQSSINEFNISPFASTSLDFGIVNLKAEANAVTGGRRNGDYRLSANLSTKAGKNSLFEIAAFSQASVPQLVYYHNEGAYNWDIQSYNKIKEQQLSIRYRLQRPDTLRGHIRHIETNSAVSLLSDNVWFGDNMRPVQGDASAVLLQSRLSAHLQFGWFNIAMQQMLQHSTDTEVIRVPLFASKNSLYADFTLFRGALRAQTGVDVRYHTRYYADAWNPVLGAFYRQDKQEVGNYLVTDFWINLQVKRATIYLKASHFNAPLEELLKFDPNYFSLPHYPLEDFGLYWGVVWKFFN